jgi:N-acetylglucosaminyldiphosphoundecaprenol N-acetyl-beta-D-mannosaminyltransferase
MLPERTAASHAELDVLGVRVHMLDEIAALGRIEQLHDFGPPGFVSYVNPNTVNLAFRDPAFGATLACADLRLADGFGIRIAARRQGVRVPAILNGSDFNAAVLWRAAARGWPVFLLGAQSGVAEHAAERLSERIAGLRVVGTHHGLFTDGEADAVVDRVRASQATVLMVALGQPRQEQWLVRHLERTGARVGLGVGGFLDFSAGAVRRAPAWMNRAGLEWTYRLAQEPRRLAHRYLIGNPVFLARVLRPGARNGKLAPARAAPELV